MLISWHENECTLSRAEQTGGSSPQLPSPPRRPSLALGRRRAELSSHTDQLFPPKPTVQIRRIYTSSFAREPMVMMQPPSARSHLDALSRRALKRPSGVLPDRVVPPASISPRRQSRSLNHPIRSQHHPAPPRRGGTDRGLRERRVRARLPSLRCEPARVRSNRRRRTSPCPSRGTSDSRSAARQVRARLGCRALAGRRGAGSWTGLGLTSGRVELSTVVVQRAGLKNQNL